MMAGKEIAIVLVSGGMDSCVTAAIANQQYEMAFLHVRYGQRTEAREYQSFTALADYYQVKNRRVADIPYLKEIGGSCLTDDSIEVPAANLERKGTPISYVPFRNTHLLSLAVSWAEVTGVKKIFIGAVEEDSSGYPDCRKAYFDAFNQLLKVGTKPGSGIEVETPLVGFRKKEIVLKGAALNAPFHLTWSCYQRVDIACGRCDSCALRLRGFREAGIDDPLPYQVK
jgi:7-cyano-7-deazaguanine synthase